MIKWLFFDLGSTIIDECECEEYRLEMLLKQPGAPDRGVLGQTMINFASHNQPHYKNTAEKFCLQTSKWPVHLEKLYPWASYVLEELSLQYHLGIIANQIPGTTQRLADHGIRQYFKVIAESAELGVAKPDPLIFKLALTQANCKPEESIMIGDRLDNDIAPAAALGMNTIWVRQGYGKYGNPKLLEIPPNTVIDSLEKLPAILRRGSTIQNIQPVDRFPPNATK